MRPASPRAAYVALLLATSGLLLAQNLLAQNTRIVGPVLGFAWDQQDHRVRPILGVAGAASIGKPVDPGMQVATAAISPANDILLAVSADDGQTLLMPLKGNEPHRAVGCEAGA